MIKFPSMKERYYTLYARIPVLPFYQLHLSKQHLADDFLSEAINHYSWFVFVFYSNWANKKNSLSNRLLELAVLAEDRAVFVDFLNITDESRKYLYSEAWLAHLPKGINLSTKNIFRRLHERSSVSDESRICLENLFYTQLFSEEDAFLPCVALINTKTNLLGKLYFSQTHDDEIVDSVLNVLTSEESGYSSMPSTRFRTKEIQTKLSLNDIFANFLDLADDALDSLSPKLAKPEGGTLTINGTTKFFNSFNNLTTDAKGRARKIIDLLLAQEIPKNNLKKIRLSKKHYLFRIRITDRERLHFTGGYENPVFINVGSHRLFDFGFKVD